MLNITSGSSATYAFIQRELVHFNIFLEKSFSRLINAIPYDIFVSFQGINALGKIMVGSIRKEEMTYEETWVEDVEVEKYGNHFCWGYGIYYEGYYAEMEQ